MHNNKAQLFVSIRGALFHDPCDQVCHLMNSINSEKVNCPLPLHALHRGYSHNHGPFFAQDLLKAS
jgi:hypothetical protein